VRKTSSRQIVPVDPLRRYLAEVQAYPVLSAQDEKELARLYHEKGDIEAAKKLVTTHLRLVVRIAMEYRSAYHNVLDLIQEGNIGLLQAVQHFEPEKGARLAHYASWWIRSYILKYILDNFRLIKIGTTKNQRKLFYNLMQEKEKIEAMGYKATPEVLSKKLGVEKEEVEEMQRRLTQPEYALEAPAGARGTGRETLLQDFIADNSTVPVDDEIAKRQTQDILKEKLDEFAKTLDQRELKIFRDRLLAEIPITLQDIAYEYGITKERVRQIEERIITRLKAYFKEKGVEVEALQM
jgi:RNA polymerase sigma-32 factor